MPKLKEIAEVMFCLRTPFLKMILNESQLFGLLNHLSSNMFREYVETHYHTF
jgi:hypothetical protein